MTLKRKKSWRPGQQGELGLKLKGRWGGKRKGAGRKPQSSVRYVSHKKRPRFDGKRFPLHVTWRLMRDVPTLRDSPLNVLMLSVLGKACDRFQTRITSYSLQDGHLHMLVESQCAEALGKAMQGLGVRMAKRTNRALDRRGPVVADHYHASIVRTPTQMLYAIIYVLNNRKKHLLEQGIRTAKGSYDRWSSARSFPGWLQGSLVELKSDGPLPDPVARPRTWLQREGWKKVGIPSLDDIPSERSILARD